MKIYPYLRGKKMEMNEILPNHGSKDTGCPKKTKNANSALNLKHFTNNYKREHAKLTITRSFHNRIRSGLLYLKANSLHFAYE